MKPALIITAYNRPEYVERCFNSLSKVDLKGITVVLVDDASTQPLPKNVFCDHLLKHTKNTGIKKALLTGIEYAISLGCDVFINLDSDAIVAPDFIDKVLELHRKWPTAITSGFNSTTKGRNPIIMEGYGYYHKRYANGINMCFNRKVYEEAIKPSLTKVGNWDFNASNIYSFATITKPSVVQHIGYHSSMGHDTETPDYAHDFKEFHLPDVTLFGIDARDPNGIRRAAEISTMNIQFGDVKIITEKLFEGHAAYSDFCINKMPDYIHTSHALIIHADGYVVKPEAWRDEWLQYDYIGAPWEWIKDDYNIGNGGFNLRSKKLMEAVRSLRPAVTHPEDSVICRELRPQLELMGIRFAPLEVCRKFSIEAYASKDNKYNGQFGFHSRWVDMSALPKWIQLPKRVMPVYPKKKIWYKIVAYINNTL